MRQPKRLGVIGPSIGIERSYQRKLDKLIERMHADVSRQVGLQYQQKPPEFAQDASPAAELAALMRKLKRKWQGNFDDVAPEIARVFADGNGRYNDAALKTILRKHGFTVKLRLTASQNDILQATVAESVSLIKSIASEHLSDVEGMVMRSVAAGRDVGGLNAALQARYDITRKRAALIARQSNNAATAALQANRQAQLGLIAIWLHSRASREPRASHVANSGNEYDPAVGWLDPAVGIRVWPGSLIGCKCKSGVAFPKFPKAG
jgi:uncharacterized protein with gpF-like domain